jgi:putative hydrolase of the HAD superfamily
MSEGIESVCFDLDDTLYAYERYARAGLDAAADRLEALTGERYHEELREIYFDDGRTEGSFDLLIERNDIPPELVDELVEAYHSVGEPLTAYPETEAVLDRLGERYELGLITDGRGGHEKLRRLGIRDRFDSVLVTPTIGRSKHDPTVFERVLTEMSVDPEAAVYVGDDPRVDFTVPNELGMRTVRLRRGRYRLLEPLTDAATPDYEIQHLDELPGTVATIATAERPTRHRGTDAR